MGFWEIFKSTNTNSTHQSGLHAKIEELLPGRSEEEHILIACVAGLMARVAYVDFELHKNEEDLIGKSLSQWTQLNPQEIAAVEKLAIEEIQNLSGLENHKYCHPLNDILNNDQKYDLLVALFAIAAIDGEVEQLESEEIRIIAKGLLLEPKYFIAARATVVDYLKSLK